jgi:geranylgeranylglycerol-phosphate geranylgeranyltransferase
MSHRLYMGIRSLFAGIEAGVDLMRLFNCAMSATGVWLGAGVVLESTASLKLICAMACGALITAGGNTVNDCCDALIDEVNHPDRPIPSRRVSKSAAWSWAISELALGLGLGFLANVTCGLIAVLAVILLLAYEAGGLKNAGLPGNITIGLLTGLLFVTGGAVAGDLYRPGSLAILAFLGSVGREIIKDIEDIAGDTTRRTWPMRVGIPAARRGAAAWLVVAVLVSPLPWWLGMLSPGYLPMVLVADAVFVWTIVVLFTKAKGAARCAKLAMVLVLAAFLIGELT